MTSLPALNDVFSYKSLVHAIAGATGSSTAITVFFPIEVARVRVQVEDGRVAKYSPQLIMEIYQEEGLSGLFRGWAPVVTSICCSNFIYFYVFNSLKAISYPKGVKPYPAKDLLLAFSAGVVNVLITTPLWVANTRLKLQGVKLKDKNNQTMKMPKYNYKGLIDAMRTIARTEGIGALWSSTVPSLILASNPAVQFMVYESLKRRIQKGDAKKVLSGFTYFAMGALSKMIATMVTYPLQVIQARARAGTGDKRGAAGLIGLTQALQKMAREQGLSGLYKGLEAKLTQTVLMAALMFLTYEKIAAVVFRVMRQEMAAKA